MSVHEAQVQRALRPGEQLLLLTDTDIGADGRFGRRWLAVTDVRLLTFTDEPAADGPDLELPLKDVEKVTVAHMVGHAALEAEAAGRKVELLRFSNSLSERFAKVAKTLTDARKDDKTPEFDLEEEEARTCLKCGRLLPEKGSFCPACLKKREVLARIWVYMRPHWPKLAVLSLCLLAATACGLVPPYLTKRLVDDVFMGTGGAELLLLLILALVGCRLVSTALEIVRGRLSARLGARIIHDVRLDLYQAIQRLSLRKHDKTRTGSLLSRLTGDTTMLGFALIDGAAWFLPNVLMIVGICVMLFVMSWRLALLVLLPVPAIVPLTLWFYRRLSRLYHRWYQRRAKMSALATDSISGIRVVKAISQEPQQISRFGHSSTELYKATASAESMWATGRPLIVTVTAIGGFLVCYFGRVAVLKETLSLGTLMAIIGYLSMFYGPIQMLTGFSDFANRAFTAAQRLFEITDAEQEVYEDPESKPLHDPEGALSFEDVHFGYTKDRPVLKGMDLDVQPGEMIGLVGKSGAGKTTMTNLICRFYDVDEGAIKLDGVDLRKIRLRDLRRHIGIVPQESFLFNGTVFENIRYAQPDATRDDVIRAAIAANAHGFIMRQPDGYDTRVGERGARLSGGEKQRIAIARAILHNPKILILDEATSSVDTETEELIQQALGRLVEGRTTFAIAHRLSTLRHANRLLVIEEGKPTEVGTHAELLAKKGTYQKLVEMQSKLSAMTAVDG